jgi:hypothetical protein
MQTKNALVAVLCSAVLSAGLAIGLGAGGAADAASKNLELNQLKAIRGKLGDVNRKLDAANGELRAVNNTLGGKTFYNYDILQLLTAICDHTPGAICRPANPVPRPN